MTETPSPVETAPPTPSLDPRIAWAFCCFAGGWWRGETARRAWILTLGLGLFLAASTGATVALNHWNRWFFDALEKKDVPGVWSAVLAAGVIVAAMAAIGVGIVLTRETLQIRWRAWLIDRLVGRWLGERRFYHLNATRTEPANPEYRIADDTRWATEPLTDLGIGLVIAVLNAAAFISILWSVGGSYPLVIGDTTIVIPAYMVLLALGYGCIMSALMLWIGRPLPSLVYGKNEREGDFRFALMRLRENAESVALMSGQGRERAALGTMFDSVVGAWLHIVRRHGHVTWITNSSGPLIPIVPLLFAAPKYLSGDLSLGQVTQLAGAFLAVQGAISWVVDNFNRIAEWYASARRVMDIVDACDGADASRTAALTTISVVPSPSGSLVVENVTVVDPMGLPLVANVSFSAEPGTSTHITGDTSVGKTTLVRALSGVWTWGSGAVKLPANASVAIVPQKPYLPLGSLGDALHYPSQGLPLDVPLARAALASVGLAQLGDNLSLAKRWDQVLSNGERQRLAIARLLVQKPDIVILDDALSALDAASQVELMKVLRAGLAETIMISLGQAQPPAGLHDQVLTLVRTASGATLETGTSTRSNVLQEKV
jgi:vitamin B12/bleomycin/antimicrobial peptide transport system ATP-binding/permease protein